MTKPLNTQLSQHDGPTPRNGTRTRTWLVALLGFGVADLIVLNLWAVPNLITNTTTTDMRAAQSGESHPAPNGSEPPPAAAAAPAEPEPEPEPEPAKPREAEAPDQLAAAQPEAATPQATEQPVAQPEAAPAQPEAAKLTPEPEKPVARAPAETEPTQPAPAVGRDADAPPERHSGALFAIRAAQRAVQLALQDRAGVTNLGPFDGLTTDDKPLTQIYFSMGNFSLGPNGKQVLERMLPQFSGDERPILIVGAADPSGGEQVNEKLSDARAQSVAEWLLAHGVDASRIQTRGIGHEGAVGSSLDRRVDIWLGGSR